MSALFDLLIPRLKAAQSFPALEVCAGPPEYLLFRAVHPDVGDVQIYDDEDELTIVFGNFTHCHYGEWTAATDEWVGEAVDAVIADLEALFGDRLMMWGTHKGGGGIVREREHGQTLWEPGEPLFVWSGPLRHAV